MKAGDEMANASRVSRRALIGAALLVGAAGCGVRANDRLEPGDGGPSVPPPPDRADPPGDGFPRRTTRYPAPTRTPTPADWHALAEHLVGKLLRPGDAGYQTAHQLFDPVFDGVLPAAVIQCAVPADVSVGLTFAERFDLEVVGKSGGHSYVGASTTQGGIVLDVGPMATVTFESDDIVRIGAGADLGKVYSALGDRGRLVPAGSCPSVGIAGLALGGGLGLANRVHGLTCDVLEQVEVVTADGKVRTATSSVEPNLFWACRGGGGGTLGIVTAFWLRTVPAPLVGFLRAQWPWSHAAAVTAGWQRFMQAASDEVWSSLRLIANPDGTQNAAVFGIDASNDPEDPLRRLISEVGVEPDEQSSSKGHRIGPDPPGQRTVFFAGSDILGEPLPSDGISAVLAAMDRKAHATRLAATAAFDSLGGAISRLPVDATAFPWRKSFASIQWYAERGGATPTAAREWIAAGHRAVARWSVGGYVNYLETARPDGAFYFGPNLARLRAVKREYDPKGVFKLPYSL